MPSSQLSHAFQPIRDIRTGEIIGYEALARVRDRTITDHLGLLARLGPDAQREFDAVSVRRATARAAPHLRPGQILFVNVTTATVLRVLEGGGWPELGAAVPVVWELPEDRSGTDPILGPDELATLGATGAELALDDLGEGYADLQRVALAGQRVWCKIGRSLVHSAETAPRVRDLLRVLGTHAPRIIAEGVEHKEALGLLADAGVAYVQGFATGRPGRLPRETSVRGFPITGGASL